MRQFDPDQYRMTIGEHLEELRLRLILALIGLAVAFVVCLFFGQQVMAAFCRPLISVLQEYEVNPQVYFTQISDPFMVFIKISLISATVIASPWMIWQMWQFVAAGLYPHERRIVTRYVPLSLSLLIAGIVFVYWLVLPWTLKFFVLFGMNIPLPAEFRPDDAVSTTQPTTVSVLRGDPVQPLPGQIWLNQVDGRVKISFGNQVRVFMFGPQNLASPMITLPNYIDLVFGMLATFAISFQLPLVIMALVAAGILDRQTLKKSRRYVYFVLAIIAAAITPGDVITTTVALMIPLIGLFELGIWLSRPGRKV